MFDMIPFRKNNNSLTRGDYLDQFFDNFFNDGFNLPTGYLGSNFKVDLKETENSYVLEADLPGIEKDAINIDYSNNYLTVSAKREDCVEDKKENYVRKERHYGEFKRSFYVDNIDENNIDASFKDGVLKINLPKNYNSKDDKKRIEIH